MERHGQRADRRELGLNSVAMRLQRLLHRRAATRLRLDDDVMNCPFPPCSTQDAIELGLAFSRCRSGQANEAQDQPQNGRELAGRQFHGDL